MLRVLAVLALLPTAALAQSGGQSGGQSDSQSGGQGNGSTSSGGGVPTPNLATEIVIEDLTLQVKRLRIGVALSPEQIEGITKALSGVATVSAQRANGENASDGEDASSDDASSGD